VDMAMGEQYLLDGGAAGADRVENERHIAARIDDGAAPGLLIENQRAVLLKRCYGNDERLEFCHGPAAWLQHRPSATGGVPLAGQRAARYRLLNTDSTQSYTVMSTSGATAPRYGNLVAAMATVAACDIAMGLT